MSTMIAEVYEAFKEAGVSEKHAMAASRAIADKESLTTKADLANLKGELKEEISNLKGELKEEISDLKGELKGEISDLKGELKEEISNLKGELKGEIIDLKGNMKGEISDLKGDMKALKWMIGFMLAGIASLVVKSFFVIPL